MVVDTVIVWAIWLVVAVCGAFLWLALALYLHYKHQTIIYSIIPIKTYHKPPKGLFSKSI